MRCHFILTLGLTFLGFSGLGISIWPHIIPPSYYPVAGRSTCAKPGIHAGGRLADNPHHFGLHLLELLRFPWKKCNTARAITDAPRNLETFTVGWLSCGEAAFLALTVVGMFFRLLMTAAGFKS
ncbi:cytochrome bd-II oxidase subunit II [Salmonella bongori]|nr:cytochrome bd-II oxidase subunit II [Salmonella bongori]